jgi:hypothetical protein
VLKSGKEGSLAPIGNTMAIVETVPEFYGTEQMNVYSRANTKLYMQKNAENNTQLLRPSVTDRKQQIHNILLVYSFVNNAVIQTI